MLAARRMSSGQNRHPAPTGAFRSGAFASEASIALPYPGGADVKQSVKRVADALADAGIQAEILELSASTRTAEEAAAAIGTTVPRIVKSLVFLADDVPLLALVSGSNRLDTDRLGQTLGRQIGRADA